MKLAEVKQNKGQQKITANLLVSQKPNYLRLEFSDSTRIVMNIFSDNKNYEELCKLEKDKLLLVDATIEYKGPNSAGYDQYELTALSTKERPSLMDVVEIEKLKTELRNEIMELQTPELKELLFAFCKDKDFLNKFFDAPCTEKSAYSFHGGILAHTVRLCKLIENISETFENWDFNKGGFNGTIDEELLKTIAIFHDAGRALSYQIVDEKIEKTMEGELLSSTELSIKLLNKLVDENELSITEEQLILLTHAISASGSNSQCAPRTKEALVFNMIEKMDTIIGNFEYMDKVSIEDDYFRLLDKQYCLINFEDV